MRSTHKHPVWKMLLHVQGKAFRLCSLIQHSYRKHGGRSSFQGLPQERGSEAVLAGLPGLTKNMAWEPMKTLLFQS